MTTLREAAQDIKALQAEGKGPAPCARFCEAKAFEIEIRNAERERDEYRKAADAMAAAHKVERDGLMIANRDLSNWFDALKADHDALLVAGKLALEALNQSVPGEYDFVDCFEAREALKKAGVK